MTTTAPCPDVQQWVREYGTNPCPIQVTPWALWSAIVLISEYADTFPPSMVRSVCTMTIDDLFNGLVGVAPPEVIDTLREIKRFNLLEGS